MANKKERTKFQKTIDRISAYIFLTPEGKPKSALLLYSFCLSIVFFLVYGAAYLFLIDVIENASASFASVATRNILQSCLPGIAGTLICCLAWFIPGDKRLLPYSYLWLCAYALFTLVAMILLLDIEEYSLFFYFFLMVVPVGLISGTVASQALYRRHLPKKQ